MICAHNVITLFAKLSEGNMENETRLNIKLTEDLLLRVKQAARKKGLTVSALTRLLLIDYVESIENERKNSESKKETT